MKNTEDIKIIASEYLPIFFKDLGPVSITVIKPEDVVFLTQATLRECAGGSQDAADKLLIALIQNAKEIGAEEAVRLCFNEGEAAGFYIPDYVRPLMTMMVSYTVDKDMVGNFKKYMEEKQ